MSDFDPGFGWRVMPIDSEEIVRDGLIQYDSAGRAIRQWVRDVLVPALPTAPYTVIRVTWKKQYPALNDLFTRLPTGPGQWILWRGETSGYTPSELIERITGFEILSEPRAVTAKAVLDRLHELMGRTDDSVLRYGHFSTLEQEFGAES